MNPEPWGQTTVVGKPLPRVDAYERVSGAAVYTRDVSLPGMLHAAVLRCPHAHARVKRIDPRAALAMPGVHAVLTHLDEDARIELPKPWWVPDGPSIRLFDPHCRYAGAEVAAVAAESLDQAAAAARAIEVEYEPLPFTLDAQAALQPGAPAVHDSGNALGNRETGGRGDVAKGFAEAGALVEESFRTSCAIHCNLEPHGCVAAWDGDRLTVWESSQAVHEQHETLARAFSLPLSSVRVVCRYMGGGFGSKAELGEHTLIAALLARRTARPVKLIVTREDSFLCVGNRPPHTIRVKAGAKKDGTLTALEYTETVAMGAYPDPTDGIYPVLDLYLCPNVRAESVNAYTHSGKSRAMRAPGFPPAAWALEQALDELAAKLGMDPVEFRLKNYTGLSQLQGNRPFTSAGLKECLVEGARAFGWKEARQRPRTNGPLRRGVGVAAAMWPNSGGPPATVILKLLADGSLNLTTGVTEIGTGSVSMLAMVASEELGVPLDKIQVEWGDTASTPFAQGTGGSRTVINNTPAVRAAAAEIRRQLLEMAAAQLKRPAGELTLENGKAGGVPYSELKALAQRRLIMAVGERHPNISGKVAGVPFAAHFAEVEVDTLTGEVRVLRFLAVHDSGRVMNWRTFSNQVSGGVQMGLGYGLTEERRIDRQTGRVLNANLHDYKVPTALETPLDLACLPIDLRDAECNTTGAKGLGEPATIPTAAAIANAVFNATGIRFTENPITPMRMLALLAKRPKQEGNHAA